jgi:hypothetical protein
VSLRPGRNCNVCWTRMSLEMLFFWYSPTSKICPSVVPFLPHHIMDNTKSCKECHERCRDHRQVGSSQLETTCLGKLISKNFPKISNFYLVHPIHLCYLRRWSLRRFGMACKLSSKGWSSVNFDVLSPSRFVKAFHRTIQSSIQPLLNIDHWCSIP